jgi:hypothetical protein
MFRAASAFFVCLLLLCAASGARAQISPSPSSDGVTVTLPGHEAATAPSSALDFRAFAFGFLGQLASSAWLSGAMPSVQPWSARVVPSGRWFKSTQGVVRDRPALRSRRAVGAR